VGTEIAKNDKYSEEGPSIVLGFFSLSFWNDEHWPEY
jgi:hypothetical protein